VQLTGIDLNPYAAACGSGRSTPKQLGNRMGDGQCSGVSAEKPVDIVVSSLTAHHLEDKEIVACCGGWKPLRRWVGLSMIWSGQSGTPGCLGGWSASWAGTGFVRHDAPVSFRRALRAQDWVRLLTAAEVPREAVTVEHWRPGRLCVGRWK